MATAFAVPSQQAYSNVTTGGGEPVTIWVGWCNAVATRSANYTAGNVTTEACNVIWTNWNQPYVTGSNCIATGNIAIGIWQAWVNAQGQAIYTPRLDPIGQEERERLLQAETARFLEYEQRRTRAEVRARSLLVDHLLPEQRDSLEKRRCFELVTRDGKRRYRVHADGQVRLLDGQGQEVESYCIHEPGLYLPRSDSVLAKTLLLEANEERFLKIANKTVLRRTG
jgi:hypothetical protein